MQAVQRSGAQIQKTARDDVRYQKRRARHGERTRPIETARRRASRNDGDDFTAGHGELSGVTDDFGDHIPITGKEVEIIETYLRELLELDPLC
jgi:hypothetical protein